MARSSRLVLVDGSWLVFRAFFAIPANLSTSRGLHTNAILGFANTFRKIMAGRRPEYGAVAFDAPGKRIRDEKYPAYKGTRPSAPSDLVEQLPWIDKVVAANGFPLIRAPGYEADDLIGTLARRGQKAGMEVLIVAGDKDFAQLVGDGIRMFDPMKDVTYDPELVRKKWGVRPDQIVDLLALLGDHVDNIPGVAGIGDKGAQQLLAEHGSLEGILAALPSLKGRARSALEASIDVARLSYELATIDCEVPGCPSLDDLLLPELDTKKLDVLYRELEFNSLLTEQTADETGPVELLTSNVAERLAQLQEPIAVVPIWDPRSLVGLAFADASSRVYVPIRGDQGLGEAGLAAVRPTLADGREKVGHDVKELLRALSSDGLRLESVRFDTMLGSFLVDPNKAIPHRLDLVAKEYLQRLLPNEKSVAGAGQERRPWSEIPADALAKYAGALAEAIAALTPVLKKRVEEEGQGRWLAEKELPLSHVLARMELDGIAVDKDELQRMTVEFTARKAEIEERIYALAGKRFNIGSPPQLATVLFEELKLPVIKKTKTGYSTDAEVLERLAPKHEIARAILDQRALAKLINTYTVVLAEAVDPVDGRIHATFQQTTGVSGRLISTDPDLQRTPIRTPEGRRIRQAFVAPPGMRMVSADWSQIELRVLAHFSEDDALLSAFQENKDVHRQTASELFKVPFAAVTSEQRNVGKTVNFATIYGQGATALGQILGVPRKEASAYIEQYFATYAGVRAWLDETIAEAVELGYVTTIGGRRRYIPELRTLNQQDMETGKRIAANTPIQGSAADICKAAMLDIDRRLKAGGHRARMLLQVHDELVFEVPEAEVEAVMALVRDAMLHPWDLRVPLEVSVGVGNSWGDAH